MAKYKHPSTKSRVAKQAELAASWNKLLEAHSKPLDCGARANGIVTVPLKHVASSVVVTTVAKRDDKHVKRSKGFDSFVGSTAQPQTNQYTGTAMLGISQMHKSNSVPTFSDDEIKDIARMRR